MPRSKTKTYTAAEIDDFNARFPDLPRFRDRKSAREAVSGIVPTINRLLQQGIPLKEIASGIEEFGMMTAAVFMRHWQDIKESDETPSPKKPKVRKSTLTQSNAPSPEPETTKETPPDNALGEIPERKRAFLVPPDGHFD